MFSFTKCIKTISERTALDACELQHAGMYCVKDQHIIFL